MDDIKLSQLVCSRLCHDLIAPVGAINSGLELLPEVEDKNEVMDLIFQSAKSLAKRLTYFRTSFGYSAANNFNTSEDIQSFISNFISSHNIKLIWIEGYIVKNISGWGRLLSNAVLSLIEIAPYGGALTVQFNSPLNSEPQASFIITGDVLNLREEIIETLEGKNNLDQISPKTIQAYLTYRLADTLNLNLKIDQSTPGHVRINAFNNSVVSKFIQS